MPTLHCRRALRREVCLFELLTGARRCAVLLEWKALEPALVFAVSGNGSAERFKACERVNLCPWTVASPMGSVTPRGAEDGQTNQQHSLSASDSQSGNPGSTPGTTTMLSASFSVDKLVASSVCHLDFGNSWEQQPLKFSHRAALRFLHSSRVDRKRRLR